jgi:hypothetical protein
MAENEQKNSEPLKYSLDFEVYLMKLFNAYAGMKSKLTDLGDGNFVVEYEQDPQALPLCNVKGALHLVNQFRKLYNRHVAMGNLERDEIADIAGNFCRSTISPMFVFIQKFGITSMSLLENEGLNTFDSLYTYLTSIKEGGLMNYGKEITTVTYVQKAAGPQEGGGIYGQK